MSAFVPLHEVSEFSIEANPGTLTDSFAYTASTLGINRVSFGMQAYQDSLLKLLGRIHGFQDVAHSAAMARKYGIGNINLDLMFGIPGQTFRDWKETLEAAVSLAPVHISAYGLIPEEGTPLAEKLLHGELVLPEEEEERSMYDFAIAYLQENGYEQYEISNFARKGYECVHNIGYWTQVPYTGLGVSAASMQIIKAGTPGMHCIRMKNPDSLPEYYRSVRSGLCDPASKEIISPADARFETMMLSLRMTKGISEHRFMELHGVSMDACFGEKLREMSEKGLMVRENGYWKLTRRGMDIQNSILVELMDNPQNLPN